MKLNLENLKDIVMDYAETYRTCKNCGLDQSAVIAAHNYLAIYRTYRKFTGRNIRGLPKVSDVKTFISSLDSPNFLFEQF
jgi:hypothetical protein